jgi:hypothetical protein
MILACKNNGKWVNSSARAVSQHLGKQTAFVGKEISTMKTQKAMNSNRNCAYWPLHLPPSVTQETRYPSTFHSARSRSKLLKLLVPNRAKTPANARQKNKTKQVRPVSKALVEFMIVRCASLPCCFLTATDK